MPKYRICYHVDATGWSGVITADSPEEAQAKDIDFMPDVDNTELGDVISVLEVEEVE